MSAPDFSKIRAVGAHVFVEILKPDDPDSIATLMEGWYYGDGKGIQKVGFARAKIISIGSGYWESSEESSTGKQRFVEPDPLLKPGSIVIYRGYLGEAAKPHPLYGDDYAFLHMKWLEIEEIPEDEGYVRPEDIPGVTHIGLDMAVKE